MTLLTKLLTWWNNFMKRKRPSIPTPAPSTTFSENFATLDPARWTVSTWTAPGSNVTHAGRFAAENATIVDGMLCLKLSQTKTGDKFYSVGGEIASKEKFGYGTYEFSVRASSRASTPTAAGWPVSGSITGCFNYLDSSMTEIDVEVEGGIRSHLTQFTSWIGETKPNQTLQVAPNPGSLDPDQRFFTYSFVWSPGKIVFSIDNMVTATFTNVVPNQPAPMMFNHWGTNNENWGGLATPDVDRYMWVRSFKFTPL